MKIGLHTKKKKPLQTYLAIDIGTGYIKTTLFFIEDRKAMVVGYDRAAQEPFSMNKAVIMDVDSVVNTLDKSIGRAITFAEEINQFDIKLPQEMVIGIAGELVSGVPIIVNVEREEPEEKITKEEIEVILEKVKEHSFTSTREEIAEENGFQASQIAEVETVINTVSVDDAFSKDPVGLTGEKMTYRVFTSFAPKVQLESIHKISDNLDLSLQKIAVEPYVLATNLEGITNDSLGGVVIDIGAGTTDIGVVQNYEIKGLRMFAIGGNNFTKRIMREFSVDYEEAEEMKLEYANDKLDEYRKNQIRKAFVSDIHSWLLGLELALEEIEDVDYLPTTFYLCGGGAMLPDIRDSILEYAWMKHLPFEKQPRIEMLYPNKVIGIEDLTGEIKELYDTTPLALTRSFFE